MEYELTVLVHPDAERDLDKHLKTVRDVIESADGTIKAEDNWGKKKLAYTIKKEDFAIYVVFTLELPANAPLKISNTLNITDTVLRYLLVKVDEKERMKLAAAKEKSSQSEEE